MRIPITITLFRLILIPIFFVTYYLPFAWSGLASAIIFAIAGITDWLDGYMARKLDQVSDFGAFLDPVADKLMVAVALVMLVANPHLPLLVLPSAVIIGREIAISALREWMAEIGKRANVRVSYISKIKTTVQIIAIIALLACDPIAHDLAMFVGYIALYIAALLTLWTMFLYLKAAWPELNFQK